MTLDAIRDVLRNPNALKDELPRVTEIFTNICGDAVNPNSSAARDPQFYEIFRDFLDLVLNRGNIEAVESRILIQFAVAAQRVLCADFCSQAPQLLDQTVRFFEPNCRLAERCEGLAAGVYAEVFRNGWFAKMLNRMQSAREMLQFAVFYYLAQCGAKDIDLGNVARVTIERFRDVVEHTDFTRVRGRELRQLFGAFFGFVVRVPQVFELTKPILVFVVQQFQKETNLERKVAFLEVLDDVILMQNESFNSVVVETMKVIGIVHMIDDMDCHEQVLKVLEPFFRLLASARILDVQFLFRFWCRYNSYHVIDSTISTCAQVLDRESQICLLEKISGSELFVRAAAVLEQCAWKIPEVSEYCILHLFKMIEYGWKYLVALCGRKDKVLNRCLFNILNDRITQPPSSVHELDVLSAYLENYCVDDRIFEKDRMFNYLRSVMQGDPSNNWHAFKVMYYFMNIGENRSMVIGSDLLRDLYSVAKDHHGYWTFVVECLNQGRIPVEQCFALRELIDREPLSDRMIEVACKLTSYSSLDEKCVFWLLKKYIACGLELKSLFRYSLGDIMCSVASYQLVLRFFTNFWRSDKNVFSFLLEFLDFTEGRIDLAPFHVTRHHVNCTKMRDVTVILGSRREVLRIHESTGKFALKNIACCFLGIGYQDFEMSLEGDEEVHLRQTGELGASKSVIKSTYLLSMSNQLDPKLFYNMLPDREVGKTCYQILKRLKSIDFQGPQEPRAEQLLYFSEVLQCHPELLSYGQVVALIRKYHDKVGAKELRNLFGFLANFHQDDLSSQHDLLPVVIEKIRDNPKYPEMLRAYDVMCRNVDISLLLFVFEHINRHSFPVFLDVIQQRNLQDRISIDVVENSARYSNSAAFCFRLFETVKDRARFKQTVLKHAAVSNSDAQRSKSSSRDSQKVIYVAMSVVGVAVETTELGDIFRTALVSGDEDMRRAVLRMAEPLSPVISTIITDVMEQQSFGLVHRTRSPNARHCGLVNPGCLCYMNAILQQLSANSLFVNEMLRNQTTLRSDIEALQNLFVEMNFGNESCISAEEYWAEHAKYNPDFNQYSQEDAIEFFDLLLANMPAPCRSLFEGSLESVFESSNGRRLCTQHELFTSIHLDVKGMTSIRESIQDFLAVETLTGDNQYFDSETKEKIDAKHYSRITRLPSFLVCHLKRFDYDLQTYQGTKIDSALAIDDNITIDRGTQYNLVGAVLHSGSVHGGHYVSALQSSSESPWVICDDTKVIPMSTAEVFRALNGGTPGGWSAYILFFKKATIPVSTEPDRSLIPERLEERLRLRSGLDTMQKGLSSEDVLEFMKTADDEQRLVYFLRILCPGQSLKKCRMFESCVHHLGPLYVRHFEFIVQLVAANPHIGSVLIDTVASDGFTTAMFDEIRRLMPGTVQSLPCIQWIGNLLLAQDTECCEFIQQVLAYISSESRFGPEQIDVSSYHQALKKFGATTPKRSIPPPMQVPQPVNPNQLPFDDLCQLLFSDTDLSFEDCGYSIEEFLAAACTSLKSGNSLLQQWLFAPRTDRVMALLTLPNSDAVKTQVEDVFHAAFLSPKGVFNDPDGLAMGICNFMLGELGNLPVEENSQSNRYVCLMNIIEMLIRETSVVTSDHSQSLYAFYQKLVAANDAVYKESLLRLDAIILGYGIIDEAGYTHLFLSFFRKCDQMTLYQIEAGISVFWPTLQVNLSRKPVDQLGINDMLLSPTFLALVKRIVSFQDYESYPHASEVVAFTYQLVTDWPQLRGHFKDILFR